MVGSATLTTVASSWATAEPSTATASTQRPLASSSLSTGGWSQTPSRSRGPWREHVDGDVAVAARAQVEHGARRREEVPGAGPVGIGDPQLPAEREQSREQPERV